MTTIRPAAPDDATALAALAAATFTETFGHLYAPADLEAFLRTWKVPAIYARHLEDPDIFLTVAEDPEGKLVGYVLAGPCKLPVADLAPTAGEVRELYLLASSQGHGLGTRLLEGALEWLDANGRSPLYVGVWSENHGAQRLYGRYGFRKVGEYEFPVGTHMDREFILERVEDRA
jgi:ribosomal protein S18 acetylase RimI-like enzyme